MIRLVLFTLTLRTTVLDPCTLASLSKASKHENAWQSFFGTRASFNALRFSTFVKEKKTGLIAVVFAGRDIMIGMSLMSLNVWSKFVTLESISCMFVYNQLKQSSQKVEMEGILKSMVRS